MYTKSLYLIMLCKFDCDITIYQYIISIYRYWVHYVFTNFIKFALSSHLQMNHSSFFFSCLVFWNNWKRNLVHALAFPLLYSCHSTHVIDHGNLLHVWWAQPWCKYFSFLSNEHFRDSRAVSGHSLGLIQSNDTPGLYPSVHAPYYAFLFVFTALF